MTNWWEALTALQRIFALMAVPASLLLVLQTLMLVIGLGGQGHDGVDTDGDGIPDAIGGVDLDGDGVPDYFGGVDVDIDGDGIPDAADSCGQLGHAHDPTHSHGLYDYNGDGVPDHSLRIFSLRTMVAFFAIFGWTGIVLTKGGLHEVIASVLAFCAGGLAMVMLAWLLKLALDLQTAGNLDPRNAIGREGTVYLTIPANRRGTGKVTVLLQGRYIELDAVTDHDEPIKTGTGIVIRSATEEFVLTVEPVEQDLRPEARPS